MKKLYQALGFVAVFFRVMDREGRGIEYHMAKVLLFMGLVLLLPLNTLNLPTYQYFGSSVSEILLAVFLIFCASYRLGALYVNGFHYRTPGIRATTSFMSCMFFGAMSYNVWFEYLTGTDNPAGFLLGIYPAFVIAEFRAASRIRWERVNHAPY